MRPPPGEMPVFGCDAAIDDRENKIPVAERLKQRVRVDP